MGSGIIQYDPMMSIRQSIQKSGILQSEGNPLRKVAENDLGGIVGSLTRSGKSQFMILGLILMVKQNITIHSL